MELKYIFFGSSILIISVVIVYPYIRSSFNEWKNKQTIEKEARIKREYELNRIKREREIAQLERQKAIATKERAERKKNEKNKEVRANNLKHKDIVSRKYQNARIYHEVLYTGEYLVPISDYNNYDLKINGISFFIDNVKSAGGNGKLEVRNNSFEDEEFEIHTLEIIDGFAILNQQLRNKSITPRKNHSSTYREVYLTIRENSFKDINTGIIHNIKFTPFSILDWK